MQKTFVIFRAVSRKFCSNANFTMKYLNVAEKPDAAKNISGLLSNGTATRREGYSVYNKIFEFNATINGNNVKMLMTSVTGHILNYEFVGAYRNWQNCEPYQLFDAPVRKACKEESEKIKKTLERETRSCQGLIVWTDCDREGENIGFEIINICRAVKPNISVYRAKFSEITGVAVRRALANLGQPDIRQSQAVDVRSELDLRTGAAFTRYQTIRLQKKFPVHIENKLISYGSCQIPTLGFVAQRYKEAEAFVSEPFWKLKVTHTIEDLTVEFNWARNRLFDKDACEDYLMLCLSDPKATVESVVTKPKHKWRPNPMDTVELEKLGCGKLKLNAKTVMSIAEKLYTQGFISYPRTETTIFAPDTNFRPLVEMQTQHPDWGTFASRVLEWGPNPRNGKKSDQAHPPIHPTKFTSSLTGNEQRVYELITRHFLACISKDAIGSETIVNITIAGEKFSASGLCIYERNYLDVYLYEKWNAKEIHKYENGQVFDPTEISMSEGSTTAPPLLTEADLIALMEKHGIGTDATHAEHIDTIKERGYIGEVDRGFLVPGTIGMGLYEGYEAMELPLAQHVLRAEFENDLKKICAGEKDPKQVLSEQIVKYKEAYRIITEKVRALDEKIGQRLNENPQDLNENDASANKIQEIFKCPKCLKASMILRKKKDSNDYFIGCLLFPECKNTIWFQEGIKEISVSQHHCNRCGPDYKQIEVKFKKNNYLVFLNATSNTYTTCLACDENFRDLFQINLDSVKRTGPIVRDEGSHGRNQENSQNITNPLMMNSENRNQGYNNNRSQNSAARSIANRGRTDKKTKTSSQSMANMSRRDNNYFRRGGGTALSEPITEPTTRNFSSANTQHRWAANGNESASSTNQETLNIEEWQDFGNEFFDDEFDDIILNSNLQADMERNSAQNTARYERNSNSLISSWGTSRNIRNCEEWTNQIEEQFHNPSSITSRNQNEVALPVIRNKAAHHNIPWGTAGSRKLQDNKTSIKCSGCHQVAKELVVKKGGPNKGRLFYACPKEPSCKFFQWAEEASTSSGHVNDMLGNSSSVHGVNFLTILCESCNLPTKECTVRKDGPNKGKHFYICASANSCGFFKWADENVNSTISQGDAVSGSIPRESRTERSEPRKRKCGFCRMEGHTKNKCPRRNAD